MLKSKDIQLIQNTIQRLRKEADSIISKCVEMTWYMRGAIQYKDMLEMTHYEKQVISDFIQRRFDDMQKSKTMYPVY